MSTPASLPLSSGSVTCATCHDASGASVSGHDRVSLRIEAQALCVACHANASPNSRAIHGMSLGRAHLQTRLPQRAASGVDAESQLCLTCHDGTSGTDTGSHKTTTPGGDDHPIGVAPSRSVKASDFRSGTLVDPRVRTFQGAVGCGSCHSPYARESKLLVMSNQGSALCLSCHTPK